MPLCDGDFSEEELTLLRTLAPQTLKPTVIAETQPEINDAIEQVLKKAGIVYFYTADKKEVHAWPVKAGSDIVTCAGKIHSDLARGFIKADIIPVRGPDQGLQLASPGTRAWCGWWTGTTSSRRGTSSRSASTSRSASLGRFRGRVFSPDGAGLTDGVVTLFKSKTISTFEIPTLSLNKNP